jgi:hypothetical protein
VKVNINGHSHQVEIEAEGTLEDVIAAARQLWAETLQPPPPPGPASAGPSSEMRYQPTGFAQWLGAGDPIPVNVRGDTP